MFAPYNDMGSYPPPDLIALSQSYGWKAATAAFIQSDANGNPSWAGMPALNQTLCNPPSWETCTSQAQWLYTNLMNYINSGGNLIISQGGATPQSLAQYYWGQVTKGAITQSVAITTLAELYQDIINTFTGLVGLDFDIEGGAQSDGSIALLLPAARIIKNKYPNLPISFTLPVLPTGLVADAGGALNIVQAVVNESISSKLPVLVDVYNLMTMDFGTGNWSGTMGELSTQALSATYAQISAIYTSAGKNFSYSNLGCTPMIGVNDVSPEIFTIEDMSTVIEFVNPNKLGLLAFWDGQRDVTDPTAYGETTWKTVNNSNSGTSNPTGAYSEVCNSFLKPSVQCCIQLNEALPNSVSVQVGGEEYIFNQGSLSACNSIYPGTYTISPPATTSGNIIYTANPLTITVPTSSPPVINYTASQGDNLCLALPPTVLQNVPAAQLPTITIESVTYPFSTTSLGTPICNMLPVGSYTITAPTFTIGSILYTASSLPVQVPNNSSPSSPLEIVYTATLQACALNVAGSGAPWVTAGNYEDSMTFTITYTGANTIETPWTFVVLNNTYVNYVTVWGQASSCTKINGGLQYQGNNSIFTNQQITIGGNLVSTSSTEAGFVPTSATLNGMNCTITSS